MGPAPSVRTHIFVLAVRAGSSLTLLLAACLPGRVEFRLSPCPHFVLMSVNSRFPHVSTPISEPSVLNRIVAILPNDGVVILGECALHLAEPL